MCWACMFKPPLLLVTGTVHSPANHDGALKCGLMSLTCPVKLSVHKLLVIASICQLQPLAAAATYLCIA